MTRHQYGISAVVHQTSFRGETSVGAAKCRLFFHANNSPRWTLNNYSSNRMGSESIAIDSEAMRAKGIIVLVKSN